MAVIKMRAIAVVWSAMVLAVTATFVQDMSENEVDTSSSSTAQAITILSTHQVAYSDAPANKDYKSNSVFNARGMRHVYFLVHLSLDLVQRDAVRRARLRRRRRCASANSGSSLVHTTRRTRNAVGITRRRRNAVGPLR